MRQGANANTNQVEDTTAYTPDESEYNDLNTDRELFALRAVSQSLAKINEKKSLLYFSGGISRDGIENEASLRVGHQRRGARRSRHLQRRHARTAGHRRRWATHLPAVCAARAHSTAARSRTT